MADKKKFSKKNRTVNYRENLGLHINEFPVGKAYQELKVVHCTKGGQLQGVQGFVLTHMGGEPLFDKKGSFTFDKMKERITKLKRLKKDYQVTFHETGWIKHHNLQMADKLKKEKQKEKNKKAKVAAQKKKQKAVAKKQKEAATKAPKKMSAAQKRAALKKTLKKVPQKVCRITTAQDELGIQISENDNGQVEVLKCHQGTACKGVKGYILFKINNYQCYSSIQAVQQVLRENLHGTTFKPFDITFVKPEHVQRMVEYEQQVPPDAFVSVASSSSSSSSSALGKRKSTVKLERELKKIKAENAGLKKQVAMLKKYNTLLTKNNAELMNGGSNTDTDDDTNMSV
jgi:hypothetical protein